MNCGFEYTTVLTQAGQPTICDLNVNGVVTQVEQGTKVTVIAEEKAGHDFTGWGAVGIVLANPQAAEQSFLMPRNAVTLTALYEPHRYTLTVDGVAAETVYGADVEVTADAREGHTFTGWTAEGVELANPKSATQAFSMPDNDVTLLRSYSVNRYALTVNSATTQQEYATAVTAIAEQREGHTFTGWTATGIELANPAAATQSFAMPANDVTLTAGYTVNRYTLTVDGVASEKEYGAMVEVTAEERKRYEFTGWTAVGVTLANPLAMTQSFAMPANAVTLTTNYLTRYVEQTLNLVKGWNLVTLTGTPDEESIGLLMPYRPIAYDAENRSYVRATAKSIAAGVPLWVLCREACELTLYGKPVEGGGTMGLMAGWNCVGAVKEVPTLPAKATAWEWTQGGYSQVMGGLKAGKAYWVFVE